MPTIDHQQIRQLVDDWHAATRNGDVDRVLGLIADDAVFLIPGRAPMSKLEFSSLSRSGSVDSRPKIESCYEIQEILIHGDLATMWTKLRVLVTPPGQSEPIERAGHTLTVLRQENGQWKLARDANLLSLVKRD